MDAGAMRTHNQMVESRPNRTRAVVGVIVVALLASGVWLAHGDHDYRNTIAWFGGYAGVAGLIVGSAVATTRRRYVGVLFAGAAVVAAVLGGFVLQAYADDGLTLNSCSTNCEGGRYLAYEVFPIAYLANLFGWFVGARLGSLIRTGGTREGSPGSKAA